MTGGIHMEKTFIIKNLDCAHCGGKIEDALNRLDGVDSAVLNFPMRKLRISGNIDEKLISLINSTASAIETGVEIVPEAEAVSCGHCHDSEDSHENGLPILITGTIFFAAAIAADAIFGILPLTLALFVVSYLILGGNVLKNTVRNVKALKIFDENTLMTVATIGAFAIGEYAEAVGVMLFFRIGELFEDFAVARSRKAITETAKLKVDEADVLSDGEFIRKPSEEIKVGDILRIKNGERIAADGIVESGESRLDVSALNGEPVPVTVRKGDSVMSGSINLADVFTLRVTSTAEESMISKIAKAVEDASANKPHIDRFISRFAKIYTPIVIVAAVLTAVIPSLITGQWTKWIHSALTFLVISCPCALVLSVPLAYFSAIGAASKLGILFKGGNSVEALGKVKAVAFDKTGTLTDGSFTVTAVESFGKLSNDELLRTCGSCEQISSHPVAVSITSRCRELDLNLDEPQQSRELAGRGVSAVLSGREILCGNRGMMDKNDVRLPREVPDVAGSVVYIAVDGIAEGMIVVSDSVKKTAAKTVAALKKMNLTTALLTGDKSENARITAELLGIEHAFGELTPHDKLHEIEALRSRYGETMFIGDGINDGPVLAGADVSGAMQTGSDLAIEAADMVFMNPEPESVVRAKKIADRAVLVSYQNIAFALAIKAVVLVMGLLGHPNMWLAVIADSGTAMLLILNSIRLLNTEKLRNIE